MLAAGLTGRAVLQARVRERDLTDGVAADRTSSPVRPCTRIPERLESLTSPAASPADRFTASRRVPTIASWSVATSSSVSVVDGWNGDSRAT